MEKNIKANKHKTLTIPSREEFHKYASNIISIDDFSNRYPTGYQIDKVDRAIKWTIKNQVDRNYKREK